MKSLLITWLFLSFSTQALELPNLVANSSVRFNVSGFGNSSACVENDKNSQVMSKDFILHYLCLRL
jgi:hypothetical protein